MSHPFHRGVEQAARTSRRQAERRSFLACAFAAVVGGFALLQGRNSHAQATPYRWRAWPSPRTTIPPPRTMLPQPNYTTRAAGEHGGGPFTTQAMGEEGGVVTTHALGEEGTRRPVTTQAYGEEGSPRPPIVTVRPPATTYAYGEEGGYYPPRRTTHAYGEDGWRW